MVAIAYYSDQRIANGGALATGRVGTGHGMGGDTKTFHFKGTFTAAPLITDYIELGMLPKGLRVTGCTISATDMDTSTGMLMDLGDAGDADRLIAASAVGQANTLKTDTLRPTALTSNVVTLGHGYKYTADTLLVLTVGTAPSGTGSAGSVIVSVVMSLPTTGPMLLSALRSQDMYLAGSFLMFLALLTVIGMFISDLALAVLDPRIRLHGGATK